MNYAVIQQINGAYEVKYEGENLDSMKYNYHNWLSLLYNDTGAVKGVVKLVDGNLDIVDGLVEFIDKPAKA
jgi:hypothetical protein